MTTLLVMTVGQTDVQLVMNKQRCKLEGNTCGTLHDAIKERSWSVVDAPKGRSRDLIKVLPEGDLPLCAPKLDAVLAYFGDALPSSALVFETNRRDARDPRFAGEVMESRLRNRGVESVMRVAFLTGDEQLEDPSTEVDAVVRRSVVATLSNAIGLATANLKPDDLVFVATTGGLAAANELINELVRLHCVGGPRVTALEVPDGERGRQDDRAVEEKFHPATGCRARWHALSLFEKGNLLGAWGAVSHLEGASGQEWTQVIKWLAQFAASLPLPTACDIAVLNHQRMAVRAALRVELALRSGDIPRAVHGTVAFFEAALWDWLRERDFCAEDGASGTIVGGFTFTTEPCGEKNKRFRKRKNESVWKVNDFKEGVDAWLNVLGKASLSQLWGALDGIRDLRNDVAHNEPTPELMNDARTRMQDTQLWSNTDTFLSQLLVQDVLREFGEHAPETLLENLLANVRRRLLSPPNALIAEEVKDD
ncbi:MAG: hypothetical protein RBS02_14110 [Steroidobacteraceae bacterium]|jgi:hypothetical protein|nr:hypothetical protein [Steroidobacteraceae bacterium]